MSSQDGATLIIVKVRTDCIPENKQSNFLNNSQIRFLETLKRITFIIYTNG